MVTIEVKYEGEFHCSAVHGPSGTQIATDAPKDNCGRGEAFSPTDLTATALATCALTTMAIMAQKEGIELAGASATIEKHMVADPKRRIGALPMTITLATALDAEQKARLEEIGRNCPVFLSLNPAIDTTITFVHPG